MIRNSDKITCLSVLGYLGYQSVGNYIVLVVNLRPSSERYTQSSAV